MLTFPLYPVFSAKWTARGKVFWPRQHTPVVVVLKQESYSPTDKLFQLILRRKLRFLKTSWDCGLSCKMKNKHKLSKFMKMSKFWGKTLIYRQKAHTGGKCLTKHDNLHRLWTFWEKKNLSERKRKVQSKNFHVISRVQIAKIKR